MSKAKRPYNIIRKDDGFCEPLSRSAKNCGAGLLHPGCGGPGLYPVSHEPDDRVAGRGSVHQAADPLPHWGPADAGVGGAVPLCRAAGVSVLDGAGKGRRDQGPGDRRGPYGNSGQHLRPLAAGSAAGLSIPLSCCGVYDSPGGLYVPFRSGSKPGQWTSAS